VCIPEATIDPNTTLSFTALSIASFQETNLDLSSHFDCDSPPILASAAAFLDAEYKREFPPGQHVDINIQRHANIKGA